MSGSPYRTQREQNARRHTKGDVIGDMVRQFADPYAFLRELVQNAIDAGATAVEVGLRHDGDGSARTWVADDGCGMTRDVIESCLLRSFSSSKEDQIGKIGKYGVGFLSVLALHPTEVVVDTWTADEAFAVRVFGNQSYQLEQGVARSAKSGTVVTLLQDLTPQAFSHHAKRVRASLERWCRHVHVPLTLDDPTTGEGPVPLNRAFDLDAPATVRIEQEDFTAIVGYESGCAFLPSSAASPEGMGRFAGFYNGGLTLFETREEAFDGFEGLRFKLMSRSLRHTMSRDNVRRDDRFESLLAQVRRIALERLPRELRERLQKAAVGAAQEGWTPARQAVFVAATVHLPLDAMVLPLLEPVEGRETLTIDELRRRTPRGAPVLVAPCSSAITRGLAAMGRPVLRTDEGGPRESGVTALLTTLLRPDSLDVPESLFLAARSRAPSAGDERRLCSELAESLRDASFPVRTVAMLRVTTGSLPRTAVMLAALSASEMVLSRSDLDEPTPTDGGANKVLLLNEQDEAVRLALGRSADARGARQAAALLARIVLLETCGFVIPQASFALLHRAACGGGGRT